MKLTHENVEIKDFQEKLKATLEVEKLGESIYRKNKPVDGYFIYWIQTKDGKCTIAKWKDNNGYTEEFVKSVQSIREHMRTKYDYIEDFIKDETTSLKDKLRSVLEMKKEGRDKDNVHVIEGNTYYFDCYKNKVYDVSNYENEKSQIMHSTLERYINNKVKVKNFVRDDREDCWDDGGYCMYVGEYQGKIVLGSNYISYNNEFSKEFQNINELEKIDEEIEYKFFNSYEDVENFLKRFVVVIDELTEKDEDWGYESWDLDDDSYDDEFECTFMRYCVRNLGSAYTEDILENRRNILNLCKDSYTPRLYDNYTRYDNFVKDDKLTSIPL